MARKIFGKLNIENFKPPGTRLRVVAWDADIDEDDHMGVVPVDEDNTFSIEYKDQKWDWSPTTSISNWRPDIYLVVEWFDPIGQFWRPISKSKTYSNQDTRVDREINVSVTIPNTNAQTVYGKITSKDGNPLVGLNVTAWDGDPSARRASGTQEQTGTGEDVKFMGSSVTNEKGEYSIKYSGNIWDQAPHWSVRVGMGAWWRPDIFIKVHGEDTGVLYRSETHENVLPGTGVRIDAKIEE
jgi:hypothetical protein